MNGDKKSPKVFLAAYLSNPKVFAILIQRKADFSIKEEYLGNTVLHSVVTGNGSMPDKIKVIQMLAEKNLVSVDITDKFNATPLMNAVERGESQVAETLLTLNADFRRVDHVGNPILTRVCEKTSLFFGVIIFILFEWEK